MIADSFIYDPEDASFYSLPSEVGRKMLAGGNMTSPVASTGRNYLPFDLVKSSKPLVCFTTDDDVEDGGYSQTNWQRLHPSCWSNDDVLDVIYYVARKSSDGDDAVYKYLRGEKFQGVNGSDLYRMSRQDFCERDSVYGGLLHDCIQKLLKESEFYPPDGMSPTKFELNNIEVFKDCKEYVSGVVDEHCDLPGHLSLPKPVQELMDAEGDEPPLNLAAGAARTDCLCRDGRSLEDSPSVEIYGHEYTIDNAADFSNILQPSFITGNDIELGNECYVYTDLTSAKPSRSTGIDYSVYSRPIDLSKGPMNRRPSQRGDIGLASLTAPPGLPHRVYPVPLTLQFSGGRGGQPAKCSRKAPKRLRDGDDQQSQTKKPGKPNTNKTSTGSNGRHLWEFIRELLQASDSGDKLAGEIIRWENRAEGIFRIIDSKQVAQLWGARKRNKTMTYEKLSRALRWSRTYGFLSAVPKDGTYPKKLCFRFGDLANWRD